MPLLLSSKNLVIKSQGGKEVKAKEIIQFYKSYMEIFKVGPEKIKFKIFTRLYLWIEFRGIYSYQFAELGKGKKSAPKKRGEKKSARGTTIRKG